MKVLLFLLALSISVVSLSAKTTNDTDHQNKKVEERANKTTDKLIDKLGDKTDSIIDKGLDKIFNKL
ncbi:hypothetical protein [Campylobacter jejuni]|uniref:hypothetical protein n=1 Tax=Campylobacter jejuni TaxID=197 RepID=UPI000F80F08C|nr:hypothetical protein [Campylobacter jejuni]RTJ79334.1 hypothetical protein C3H52_03810 [Campylobacter jejuni]RTJ87314.1 hypothetical protein C3H46_06135 [Campylobacter jejuni]RTJ95939.1 hypothetical protein C3H43_00545 [Campylobacter jejuni]